MGSPRSAERCVTPDRSGLGVHKHDARVGASLHPVTLSTALCPLQLRPRRRNLTTISAHVEGAQQEAAGAASMPSQPAPPPPEDVPRRPLSSYDDMDGYEAGMSGTGLSLS